MLILDGPDMTFAELDPRDAAPAPPLASIGTSPPSIETLFQQFAGFVDGGPAASMRQAIYDKFIGMVAPGHVLPAGKTLYQAIAEKYAELEFDAMGGTLADKDKFFRFSMFLYITLYHFSIWYAQRLGSGIGGILPSIYYDHIRKNISKTYFAGGIRASKSVLNSTFFPTAFKMNGTLVAMHDCFNTLGDRNFLGRYSNIIKKNGTTATLTTREYLDFRHDLVAEIRRQCAALIEEDVRIFLGKMLDQFPGVGERMLRGFASMDIYAVGNGGTTTGFLGQLNYGILFMKYEPNRTRNDMLFPASPAQLAIPLIASDDKDGVATIYYIGLEDDQVSATAPRVDLIGYRGSKTVNDHPDNNTLTAIDGGKYQCARGLLFPSETVAKSDLGDAVDMVSCDLHSSATNDQEEMSYLIFRHHLSDPARLPQPISLSTERFHTDNQYQTVLAAASGQTRAVVAPVSFNEPASVLTDVAIALATHGSFEFDAVIEGMGIGEALDAANYGKGSRKVGKADDQRDLPDAAGYGVRRYGHAWLEWHGGSGGWLMCHATGYASPLRCTWQQTMPAAQQVMLQTFFEDLVTHDIQDRPVYNCLLSAFRAFSIFHSVVVALSQALDALGTPGAATAKQKIVTYLETEAQVSVILPTGLKMAAPPLKYATIEPFYFP